MKTTRKTKICTVCGKRKTIKTDFYANSKMADGYLKQCKHCLKLKGKAYYAANREKKAAYREAHKERMKEYQASYRAEHKSERRKYRMRPDVKARNNARINQWKASNPDKVAAHNAVRSALKSGKLVKPDSCSMCGDRKPLHGHHGDYGKPLEVIWLCSPCHLGVHGMLGD